MNTATKSSLSGVVTLHCTIADAAVALACSEKFLRNEMDAGRLAYSRRGRKRVIPIDSLKQYDRDSAVGPNHPARQSTVVVPLEPRRSRMSSH